MPKYQQQLVAVAPARNPLNDTNIDATLYEFPCDRCNSVHRLAFPSMLCARCFTGGIVVNRVPPQDVVVKLDVPVMVGVTQEQLRRVA